jgi:nicotinamide-nucleotide amidase
VLLGYRASYSEFVVKILSHKWPGEDPNALSAGAAAARIDVRKRLGEAVYSEGTVSLPEALGLLLKQAGWTFGVAESCTGGLVSQLMTSVPGASEYYLGGVTSYANSVKEGILSVRSETLSSVGAVSEEVARQMADGARRALGVDVALSLTGIAGPGGGTREKPVGLVYFAVATPEKTISEQRTFSGDRRQIQMRAALTGMWSVRAALRESGRCE